MKMVKKIVGWLIILGSCLAGVYVGGWLLMLKPIYDLCIAVSHENITIMQIIITFIKCTFSMSVAWLLAYTGSAIGMAIKEWNDEKENK